MFKKSGRFLVFLLVCVMVTTLFSTINFVSAATSVNENFEDGVANGFTVVSGSWSIVTDGSKVYKTSSDTGRSVVGDSASTSVSVQSRIKVSSWNTSTDRTAGLMARYTGTDNYYMFIYEDGKLEIQKKVSGTLTVISSRTYTFSTGTWYTFKGEVNGTTLNFYVNDTLQLTGTDNSLSAGKVGCLTFNGNVRFDDFVANDLATSAPATPTGVAASATSSTSVTVSYNASSGATGYDVEVDGTAVDNGTALTYVHSGLAPQSTHNYRVRAKNGVGTSAWSSVVNATTPAEGQTTDKFGINVFHPTKSGGKTWDSQSMFAKSFNIDWDEDRTYDSRVQLRGDAQYTCTGNGELKVGKNADGGEFPRFYIGDGATAWDGNVEVTFYSKVATIDKTIDDWAWGGLEAVVRTTHNPDTDDDNTRGYGGRITLDGDCDFEKEQSHANDANSQSYKVYPWGQGTGVPTNQWLGYKFIARDQGTGSNVHLELYLDKTSNGNLANQVWEKIVDYTDYDGKIWDYQDPTFSSPQYAYKSLRGANATTQLYVYLRSDAVNPQYYKWVSVREIDPEP